ncbi:RnfH family protein [Pusillimonas sp.]|uniref:RnfH family protein n=1 Tax=Pusillimonas sp. TaxID=3040095 RepID=UPI0037C5A308
MTTEPDERSGSGPAAAPLRRAGSGGTGEATVTVVYAEPDKVWQKTLTVAVGTDVAAALKLSGFARAFPAYPIDAPVVGIFGRRCQLDEAVSDADRIEIYRPLDFDPMESRRRRAAHRKAAVAQAAFRPRRVRDGNNS